MNPQDTSGKRADPNNQPTKIDYAASLRRWANEIPDPLVRRVMNDGAEEIDRLRANAAINIAAQDLLAALRGIARCARLRGPHGIDCYAISTSRMDAVLAAIAKATERRPTK